MIRPFDAHATDPLEGGSFGRTRGFPDVGAALQLRGLVKRYGPTIALDGLSLGVERGQMLGFVGPNNAGKTTAMRIIVGVLDPYAGEVLWWDRPADAGLRRRFGYVPEERGLYAKMHGSDQHFYLSCPYGLPKKGTKNAAARWIRCLGVAHWAGEQPRLPIAQRGAAAELGENDPNLSLRLPYNPIRCRVGNLTGREGYARGNQGV